MSPARPTPRDGEAGSIILEVVVSAVILVVAVGALFFALDVQTKASGKARASSVAAELAEADQERLRSFRVPQLSNRHEDRTVLAGGVAYDVESRGDWIRDATGGSQSCANAATQADYLRLTSTVTPPGAGDEDDGGDGTPPTVIRSLVAPPVGQFGAGQGTLAVGTAGAAGQPIEGVTTTITGPTSLSDTSNELGCTVFGYIPVGSYNVQVSAPGFVDPVGNPVGTRSATVTEGTVNLSSLQYDQGQSVAVSFDTKIGSAAPVPTTSTSLSAANDSVPGTGCASKADTGYRLYCMTTPQATITAGSLFPYTTDYAFYAGSCPAANPAEYDENYFDTRPGSFVVGADGSPAAITVRKPALNLTVQTATAGTAIHVRVRSTDTGCTDVFDWDRVTAGTTPIATLPDPALPFGHYKVCASYGTGSGARSKTLSSVGLTTELGTSQTIDLRSNVVTGTCP